MDTTKPTAGEMLRRCREARGLSVERVAQEMAVRERDSRVAAFDQIVARVEANGFGADLWVEDILAVLHSHESVSHSQHDAIVCAAGIVPADLVALILAHPERLDHARALFDAECCTCGMSRGGVHFAGCVAEVRSAT